jgi:hypothetical protein
MPDNVGQVDCRAAAASWTGETQGARKSVVKYSFGESEYLKQTRFYFGVLLGVREINADDCIITVR